MHSPRRLSLKTPLSKAMEQGVEASASNALSKPLNHPFGKGL